VRLWQLALFLLGFFIVGTAALTFDVRLSVAVFGVALIVISLPIWPQE
jgi:hypothetical protein